MGSPSRQSRCFIFQNDHLLLLKNNNLLPNAIEQTAMAPHILRRFHLGCLNNINYDCIEIHPETLISEAYHLLPLKPALCFFSPEMYGLATKAYSVIRWDKNHQFCSRCGTRTVHPAKSFERVCATCELSFFPRISPSIIVLIKRDHQLLMARSPHFPPGVYSLIAGFVDPGESIEDAVHREVREEVGLSIKNLSYWGSQPWPFPDSLMLAFTADYESGDIIMEEDEIEDAGWYPYNQLPGLPSSAISIAMKLINDFISEKKGDTSC